MPKSQHLAAISSMETNPTMTQIQYQSNIAKAQNLTLIRYALTTKSSHSFGLIHSQIQPQNTTHQNSNFINKAQESIIKE